MTETNRDIISVYQLNMYIKQLFDKDTSLRSIFVRGEISNFTNHVKTGHFYLTLKDEKSLIKAVMFASSASKLRFALSNGMKVIAHGRVNVFERDGQYQLYIDDIQPDGVGALYLAFEQLKIKLQSEGIFDPKYKKPIPRIPMKIGVITSPTGAAVRDMINVTKRRFPLALIVLFPSLVQGPDAPFQLIEGLTFFNRKMPVDVIIMGRGGGSIEELWSFNEEAVARAVANSSIPVISAVGHETDFTICDFAADLRAPTPSAAAELAVPLTSELTQKFGNVISRMQLLLSKKIEYKKQLLTTYTDRPIMKNPKQLIENRRLSLDYSLKNLVNAQNINLQKNRSLLIQHAGKLNALSPLSVLKRGFSVVSNEKGVIKKNTDVKKGDFVNVRLDKGSIDCIVEDVK